MPRQRLREKAAATLLPDGVPDPHSRYNHDIASRQFQDILKSISGKNFVLTDPFTTGRTTTGAVGPASKSITASGKQPIIGAFIPADYKRAVNPSGSPVAGGASSIQLYSGASNEANVHATLAIYRNNEKAFWQDLKMTVGTSADTGREFRFAPFMLLFFDTPGAGKMNYDVRVDFLATSSIIAFNALQFLLLEL